MIGPLDPDRLFARLKRQGRLRSRAGFDQSDMVTPTQMVDASSPTLPAASAPTEGPNEAQPKDDAQPSATASAVMDLNFALWRMGFEAPSVIAMRTMAAAGFWNSADTENQMMVEEKQQAFATGIAKASLAMWQGATPAAVMLEAVKPIKAQTGSNMKRLSKKGPRLPGL